MDWKRIISLLVYVFVFILPWQTRLILDRGILNGGSWEYGTVGLYATELLLWVILLIIIFTQKKIIILAIFKKYQKIFLAFILVLSINLFAVSNKLIWLQQLLHMLEAGFVYILITRFTKELLKVLWVFLGGIFLSACLGAYQFLLQTSFASRWLGLTVHNPFIAGTSILELVDGRWLRAYGPFQHPNIFGGFLAISIFFMLIIAKKPLNKIYQAGFSFLFIFLAVVLFFSFSRSAILALFISSALYLIYSYKTLYFKKTCQHFVLLIFIFILLAGIYKPLITGRVTGQGRLEQQSIVERGNGYVEALHILKKHSLMGVGLGNYTLSLYQENKQKNVWDYQPVHNTWFLIAVEIGFVGIVLFLFIFKNIIFKFINNKTQNKNVILCLVLIFILGFFDHYLYSLFPGLMLVGVAIGIGVLLNKNS